MSQSLDALPAGAPRAGDRFPWLRLKFRADGAIEHSFQTLDDIGFNLLVIGQPSPPEGTLNLGHLLRLHVLPADPANDAELARAQIPQPSFYLLRPDGHVGLCGARLVPRQSNATFRASAAQGMTQVAQQTRRCSFFDGCFVAKTSAPLLLLEDHAVIALQRCEAAIRRDHGLLTASHHGNEKSVP